MKLCLLAFLFLLFLPVLQAQDSGVIEGIVVDSVTGVGVPEVSVYFGSDNGVSYDATTDSAGRFRVTGVKDGVYGSKYEKAGYVRQYSGNNNSDLKPVRVGREPVRLRIEMQALGAIRGRVLDPEGNPKAKAIVALGRMRTETTDDEGQFVFTGLPPTAYKLQAIPSAGTVQPVPKPGEDRIEMVPTWFPSVVDENQGEPIVMHSGGDVSGLEIRLRTAPVYRVRGVVLDENGHPLPHVAVFEEPAAPGQSSVFSVVNMGNIPSGTSRLTAKSSLGYFIATPSDQFLYPEEHQSTAEDGTFEFPSIVRGERMFTAASEQKSAIRLVGRASVSRVVDHDIDDLQIRFTPSLTIEGSVVLAGASADDTPAVIKRIPLMLAGLIAPGRSKPDGTFQLTNIPPGAHWLVMTPGLEGGYYLDSVSLGGQDVTGQALNLQSGSPPIRVVYKSNGGSVSGTVVAADDTAVEGATAVLLPQESFDVRKPDYGRVSPSGVSGAFEIDSLKPGAYYAFAVSHLEAIKVYDPQAAQKIISGAARVQVTEGAAVSAKLRVIRLED